MGKLLLRTVTPQQVSWLRYSSALGAYLLAASLLRFLPSLRSRVGQPFFRPRTRADWGWLIGIGFFTFFFSPLFQLTGLSTSTAIDNALIVAMEPLMTVFMAWLFLRERLTAVHALAFTVAVTGFSLLTGLTPGRVVGLWDAHLLGNVLMVASLAGEAVYSVFARKLMKRHEPMAVFGNSLVAGLLLLTGLTCLRGGLPSYAQLDGKAIFGLLFLGPLGTTVTYLFWMIALSRASIPSMALTLFIQPLAGTLWGYLFLGETLTLRQALGGLLIVGAVLVPTLASLRGRPVSDAPRSR